MEIKKDSDPIIVHDKRGGFIAIAILIVGIVTLFIEMGKTGNESTTREVLQSGSGSLNVQTQSANTTDSDLITATAAAKRLQQQMLALRAGTISVSDQELTTIEVKKNAKILEDYYQRTKDCQIGIVLSAFLDYVIENNADQETERIKKIRDFRNNIKKKCNN